MILQIKSNALPFFFPTYLFPVTQTSGLLGLSNFSKKLLNNQNGINLKIFSGFNPFE
jgi:hypothetical protein